MGKIFDLIADSALEKLDSYYDECHVCNRTDIDLYPYQGKLHLENGEVDDDIYAACSSCILKGNLTHSCDFAYFEIIDQYLRQKDLNDAAYIHNKNILTEKYQKTPDIPIFMQYDDRPLCCNDITEFTGYPKDADECYDLTEKATYWEKQVCEKSEFYNFRKYGAPESKRDIAFFCCKHCETLYFTFQFT
ncbi:hypothetical protein ACR79M_01560 [Sphingobacterium spiritivorum]|uniref:hypothetical protein n=1 Tax=Sphingobacterium TaxID=28453 RepID=UPI001918161F|nr:MULTISPECIES: hypothetical protein [Sphingobacterium]QQT26056.1 hypothetical protein I6J02_20510 [Sphingobacterium spiritivorum]